MCLAREDGLMAGSYRRMDEQIRGIRDHWGWGPRVAPLPFTLEFGVRFPVYRRFERNKNVSCLSTCETHYCGEPPWPRGSVLSLRPPGLEFRILCLEDSVISFISPSSGPVYPICAQRWPKARYISFLEITDWNTSIRDMSKQSHITGSFMCKIVGVIVFFSNIILNNQLMDI